MPRSENPPQMETASERVQRHRKELWDRLIERGAGPNFRDDRTLRSFSLGEVAEILGVSGSYLRQLSIDGLGPTPELGTAGRRSYTLRQINELRAYLASARPKEALKFCPRRREGEKLQIISVDSGSAGSASTTTSFYLAQGLALQGYRVLAIDLDPMGSLSKMFGYHFPAIHFSDHHVSMYGALSYDDDRSSMSSVIGPTLFDGLDLVPGTSELEMFERESTKRFHNEGLRYPDASIKMVSALKEVEANYDVVVIHCGRGSFLTAGAYEAATGVLVTVRPEWPEIASMTMSLDFFSHFFTLIERGGRSVNHDFTKFLVTRHNPRDVSQQEAVALLRDSLGDDLLTATVWESDAIREAGLKKRSLYELVAGAVGRSAYEQAMETLNSMNAEVMDLISEVWGRPPMYVSRASRTAGKASS
ncbi:MULTISPECIES: plasmid partitioning protein RepA [Rhizobium]|uniref:Plasmid partitioning protein RepA n=1 Tax=Rhizobium indicum TaxID=2583231 RepID=A0ABX6PR52_9HYPH|nr:MULTISPECIES: plasmid partitioning protein RepA [Rhizobium]NEI65734.1 plasmid partitioning protein RepA [Rhizobium leguminosarum]NKL39312.1 plasmid partitioning protein RepA [Rhizobium leguminosarum bv. viciae]NKM99630.1 plasmid partitioning protein RepA [Rhizobium leguminosarum bv. viciae]QIJ45321.1 plasmid partitioning protein RepA [Rhizobium leguminosarum]QKK21168.1 plasmid partitioning protein RepA [Rhizobium indicum]